MNKLYKKLYQKPEATHQASKGMGILSDSKTVYGEVTDSDDNPLQGVGVSSVEQPTITAVTNSDGEFQFNIDPLITRSLKAHLAGYKDSYTFKINFSEEDYAEIMMVSTYVWDALQTLFGVTQAANKGIVGGEFIDEIDEDISNVRAIISSSGQDKYLDDDGNPDPALKNTSSSGAAIIFNVPQGDTSITGQHSYYEFLKENLAVYADSLTMGYIETKEPLWTNIIVEPANTVDSDKDGLPDYLESRIGTGISKNDTDSDGLSDYDEYLKYRTNPKNNDSDFDSIHDNNWNERREYAYTIKVIGKVYYPYDIATMNDFFQDAKVIQEASNILTYEVILYPYAKQLVIPSSYPLNIENRAYINKSTTINYNSNTISGVNNIVGGFDTDFNVANKLGEWITDETEYIDNACPETFEYLVTDSGVTRINNYWCYASEEEIFNYMLFGASMFENRKHGSCGSVATLTATALRPANISTRLTQSIPIVPGCNKTSYNLLQNLTNPYIKGLILDFLEEWDCSCFTNHFFNEININGKWVRVDTGNIGSGVLRPWSGALIKTISFPDWTKTDWANTWGKKPVMSLQHVNPYETLELSDQYQVHDKYYERFYVPLNKGWNLISVPINLTNSTLPSPLKSIQGNYSKIFTYNNRWIELKNNSKINETIGLWIRMLNNDTLNLEGNEIKDPISNLINGWNLVGYPYLEEKNIFDVFGNVSVVYSYNSSWSSYIPNRPFNSLQTLKPGYGYWLKK